jgi:hypothetical protein
MSLAVCESSSELLESRVHVEIMDVLNLAANLLIDDDWD